MNGKTEKRERQRKERETDKTLPSSSSTYYFSNRLVWNICGYLVLRQHEPAPLKTPVAEVEKQRGVEPGNF